MVLTAAEPPIAARTRKTRKFVVLLRAHRQELLDAALQPTLAHRSSPEPGGHAPVEAGLLALAPLLPASCHVGDRDPVELTGMDQRWQRVLACRGAEHPPCSQGPLVHFRRRLSTHNWAKTLRERTVALAEPTGGFGARHRRAVLDSPPRCGAGRGEETLHRLGHARRQAGGLVAQALDPATEALVEDAGLTLGGHRRLQAALDRAWGEPRARSRARGVVLEEGGRWQRWLEPPPPLVPQTLPLQEVRETITQMITQDTEPEPEGGPGERRLTKHVAPDRRIAIEDQDRRYGRQSRANTCNGFPEHCAVEVESHVTREVVVRPAHEPEPEAGERWAEEWEHAPGLLPRAIALGDLASPRRAQWAEQGVDRIARPWPSMGPLVTQQAFPVDGASRQGTCPGGPSVPMVPGQHAPCPAPAGEACGVRAHGTTAPSGQGSSVRIREDEPCQPQLRATMKTPRGRASLRQRTAGEHTMAHPWVHQGRRARYKGVRKHPCDGRRHAALSNLQVAARYEAYRLAS